MVKIRCQKSLCQYDTDQDIDPTEVANTKIAPLELHDHQVYPPALLPPAVAQSVAPQQNTQRVAPPKLILVDGKIEEAGWEALTHAWANYKNAGNVQDSNEKSLLANVLGAVYTKVFGRFGGNSIRRSYRTIPPGQCKETCGYTEK